MSRDAENIRWIWFMRLAFALLLGTVVLRGCLHQKIGKDKAIRIATEAVEPLGYKVQEMQVICSWKMNHWRVLFLPKAPGTLGGDVSVEINRTTGKVDKILRGQ